MHNYSNISGVLILYEEIKVFVDKVVKNSSYDISKK